MVGLLSFPVRNVATMSLRSSSVTLGMPARFPALVIAIIPARSRKDAMTVSSGATPVGFGEGAGELLGRGGIALVDGEGRAATMGKAAFLLA